MGLAISDSIRKVIVDGLRKQLTVPLNSFRKSSDDMHANWISKGKDIGYSKELELCMVYYQRMIDTVVLDSITEKVNRADLGLYMHKKTPQKVQTQW